MGQLVDHETEFKRSFAKFVDVLRKLDPLQQDLLVSAMGCVEAGHTERLMESEKALLIQFHDLGGFDNISEWIGVLREWIGST
jgi:hypothetical protein